MDKKYAIRLLIFLVPLGAALVALLLLLRGLNAPLPTPAPSTSTPDPAQAVVARVGERRITFGDWSVAFYLDALMSRLSGQPVPTARDTLDRLVNDALILSASADKGIAAAADVETRIALLEVNWGLTDEQVVDQLTAIGLDRRIWVDAIGHLLTVERYLAEVVWADVPADDQADALAAWLQAQHAQANVEIDIPRLQPVLPEYVLTSAATPLAMATALPSPTFTSTPLAVSPLATPSPTATPLAASPLATPTPLPSPKPSVPQSPAAGEPAPDFALIDGNGRPIRLSDYRDQSQVVIVFFRTSG
jgi:hypothetical protein